MKKELLIGIGPNSKESIKKNLSALSTIQSAIGLILGDEELKIRVILLKFNLNEVTNIKLTQTIFILYLMNGYYLNHKLD